MALNQGPASKSRTKSNTTPATQTPQQPQLPKTDPSGQLLPPKTVRQVKQRSADRQLTTAVLPAPKPALTSFSNFAEQNKHLRKLSSSIQSLHHSKQSPGLTPPPPKSPASISIKAELDVPEQLCLQARDGKSLFGHDFIQRYVIAISNRKKTIIITITITNSNSNYNKT